MPNFYFVDGDHLRCVINPMQDFIIDANDYEKVSVHKWYVSAYGYPVTTIRGGRKLFLHRMLMGAERGQEVDHINGNKLDNRRCNLRIATKRENQRNINPRSTNTTGYKGVCNRGDGKYTAAIKAGRNFYLGIYNTPEDAAIAYNRAALEHFGEFARLNVIGKPFTTISAAEEKEAVLNV